ncbi:DUF4189 domain-containing protein [Lysobacter sp. 5GHs7-4]|uniref:DUF4189 domain-containing protein n=1 Tax=Lysobacter sp. 5GHs7-4 TaxID=2904253 RepID=UPI001E5802C0|nr:DUF4189 domain-containing protein [Lysobacter sp. 5GHs7-4]UHQ21601.1 DUF4189 domain-containing protein [Lysobacter sp. 5GHs7-4]
MQPRRTVQWLLATLLALAAFTASAQQIICQAPQGGQVPCPSPFGDAYGNMAELQRQGDERRAREWAEDKAGRESDYWGALAVHAPSGEAVNIGFESEPKWAFGPLRQACNIRYGCDVVVLYKNTCVAIARGDRGEMFLADDVKPQQASALASQACSKAGAGACKVGKKELTCSGYNYIDSVTGEGGIGQKSLFAKWRKLRFDVAAKVGGDVLIQPPMATYNPRLRQALTRPKADRANLVNRDVRDDAVWARIGLTPAPDLWLAFAFSAASGQIGLGLERNEDGAVAAARGKCQADDCETLLRARSGQCYAIVQGITPKARLHSVALVGRTPEDAQKAALKQCAQGATDCSVAVAECVE